MFLYMKILVSYFFKITLLLIIPILFLSCEKDEEKDTGPVKTILYEDHFDSKEKWPDFENDYFRRTCEDGKLYVHSNLENFDHFYSWYYYYDFQREYIIETSVLPIDMNNGMFLYGLMFMVKNNYNHYYIYLSNDSYYIGYVYNYNYHTLVDFTYNESINSDGVPNIIKIDKKYHQFTIFINDEQVFKYDITNQIGDEFGYKFKGVGSFAVDYFTAYSLSP